MRHPGHGALLATLVAGVTVAAGPASVDAHPHRHVEQQAQVTLDVDGLELVLRIVPSVGDGAAMFDAVDRDGDGVVSAAEGEAFGREVLATVELRVDGAALSVADPTVRIPGRSVAGAGGGVMEVRSSVALPPRGGGGAAERRIDLDVTYRRFAPTWFVQPFFTRGLLDATTVREVERSDDGSRVSIRLR